MGLARPRKSLQSNLMPRYLFVLGYLAVMALLGRLVIWEYRRSRRQRKKGMLDSV